MSIRTRWWKHNLEEHEHEANKYRHKIEQYENGKKHSPSHVDPVKAKANHELWLHVSMIAGVALDLILFTVLGIVSLLAGIKWIFGLAIFSWVLLFLLFVIGTAIALSEHRYLKNYNFETKAKKK